MKIKYLLLTLTLVFTSPVLTAGTVGTLTFNGTTITDSASDTTYLSWGNADFINISYLDALILTDVGGNYEDYHIGTQSEAYTFFNAASDLGIIDAPADEFHRYLNQTAIDPNVFGDPREYPIIYTHFISDFVGNSGYLSVDSNFLVIDENDLSLSSSTFVGTDQVSWFLVSDQVSVVPIPAAVWLFGSGLLGLVGMARRKA